MENSLSFSVFLFTWYIHTHFASLFFFPYVCQCPVVYVHVRANPLVRSLFLLCYIHQQLPPYLLGLSPSCCCHVLFFSLFISRRPSLRENPVIPSTTTTHTNKKRTPKKNKLFRVSVFCPLSRRMVQDDLCFA